MLADGEALNGIIVGMTCPRLNQSKNSSMELASCQAGVIVSLT